MKKHFTPSIILLLFTAFAISATAQVSAISTFNGFINDLQAFQSDLFIAGGFNERDSMTCTLSSAFDGNAFVDQTNLPTSSAEFNAMIEHNGSLYAVGRGTDMNVVWNGSAWTTFGAPGRTFLSLATDGANLYMGGSDGVVTIYDGNSFTDLPALTGFDSHINAMAVLNGELHVGGAFTESGSTTLNYLGKWDGNAWQPLGNGLEDLVESMAVFNGELFIGGIFASNSSNPYRGITRWDGNAFVNPQTSGGVVTQVTDMEVYNGELYVCGIFLGLGASTSNNLAKWDGNNWLNVGNLSVSQFVKHIGIFGGMVYFTRMLGVDRHRLYRIGPPVGIDPSSQSIPDLRISVREAELALQWTATHSKSVTCEVTDLSGKTLLTVQGPAGNLQVPTQAFSQGIYVLRLIDASTGNMLHREKFFRW